MTSWNYNSQLGIVIPRFLGLRANLAAVPKLRMWTSRSIYTLSQHAYVIHFPNKLKVSWATDSQMAFPPERFEAFLNCLAMNASVRLYSRVLSSKTYGGQLWEV